MGPRHNCLSQLALALLITAALSSAGCVSHRMYRETSVVKQPGYTLAFIEFDDHGEIWSPKQTTELQNLIRATNQNQLGAVVVLLVHGWNNNASPANERQGTLSGFKQTMERVSRSVHETTPGRPVIGIYFGWRGKSLGGPLKYLTFFNRQRAAARVAGIQSTAVLGQIILETKANPNSNLVIIGHSFGGQVVERLTQQAVAQGIFYLDLFLEQGPLPAVADLTVLLNPASPATNAKQVIDLLRWQMIALERRTADGRRWNAPALVSITSEGDIATRLAYPAGSLVGLVTRRFREYGPEFCSPVEKQRRFYTRTAGHMPVLHSHEVDVGPLNGEAPSFAARKDGFTVAADSVSISVDRRRAAYNDTPYWIMRVPTEVIADHNDTWNPNLLALLSGLMSATGALEPGTEVHVVRNEGLNPVLLWPRSPGTAWLIDESRRISGVTEGQADPVLVGCIPEGIDLATVIGHDRSPATLLIAQWHSDPGDVDRRTTEIVEIGIAPGGFGTFDRTIVRSDEHFIRATVDHQSQRVYLASEKELYVVNIGKTSARPELIGSLDLVGSPAAMVFDRIRERILILDSGSGALVEFNPLKISQRPETVVRDLGSRSVIALDPGRGCLYAIDRDTQTIFRWQRTRTGFDSREVVTKHESLLEPSSLEVGEDGLLWVGDPAANRVFLFSNDGELVDEWQ